MTSPQCDDREGPHPPWCELERVTLPHGSVRMTAGRDEFCFPSGSVGSCGRDLPQLSLPLLHHLLSVLCDPTAGQVGSSKPVPTVHPGQGEGAQREEALWRTFFLSTLLLKKVSF